VKKSIFGGGKERQSRKPHSGTIFWEDSRNKAGKHTAVQFSGRTGEAKPETSQRYNFQGRTGGAKPETT
jgi:hypothetical protein